MRNFSEKDVSGRRISFGFQYVAYCLRAYEKDLTANRVSAYNPVSRGALETLPTPRETRECRSWAISRRAFRAPLMKIVNTEEMRGRRLVAVGVSWSLFFPRIGTAFRRRSL